MNHTEPELPSWDTANIHLQLWGKEHTLSIPIPLGRRTPLELLPAARELSSQASQATVAHAREEGKEISCRAGCGACCRQLVAISVVEAQGIAELVASMPAERQTVIRQRFADALARLEASGLLDANEPRGERAVMAPNLGNRLAMLQDVSKRYFQLKIPCPFLEEESCGIHPDRPMVCREYHVTSPAENCSRLHEVEIDRLLSPLRMGHVLARTVEHATGIAAEMIPLVLSLEWSEAHGEKLRKESDGMEMFKKMIDEIDPAHEEEFERRSIM